MKKLIVFDMDSTLIQCEVVDELARKNNCYETVAAITESAMKGEIDFEESLRRRVSLLKGLSLAAIEELAENLPYTKSVAELFDYLNKKNYKTAILSGGFSHFAKVIQTRFSIDYIFSNELEMDTDQLTGRLRGELIDAEKKAFYLQKIADEERIPMSRSVAVGDGSNDILMLKKAAVGIAFCGKEKVRKASDYQVEQADMALLQEILENYEFT